MTVPFWDRADGPLPLRPATASRRWTSGRRASELRHRFESERDARRRQREAAAARAQQRATRRQAAKLRSPARMARGARGSALCQVDDLAETKQSSNYKQAVALLKDLFDLALCAARTTRSASASGLRARHVTKSALLRQLAEAGFAK